MLERQLERRERAVRGDLFGQRGEGEVGSVGSVGERPSNEGGGMDEVVYERLGGSGGAEGKSVSELRSNHRSDLAE